MRGDAVPGALLGARARSREVNRQWRAEAAHGIGDRFVRADDAATLIDHAQALLADTGWVTALLEPLVAALDRDPWFEPALRTSRDAMRTGVVLFDDDRVSIGATVTSAHALNALPPADTLVLSGRIGVTRYARGGNARLRRWSAPPISDEFAAAGAEPCRELPPVALHDGLMLVHDGRETGHLIVAAESDIVALTLTLKRHAAPLMREYAVADGRLVRTACADDMASRTEMLLTFLRVAERTDAAPAFAATTHHPAFHLRWAAMREWLMLDAAAARPRLAQLAASDANAEIRAAATATLAALERQMAASCRA